MLEPVESDWVPAQIFFEERKVRRADLAGAGEWHGWSHELDDVSRDVLEFGSRTDGRFASSPAPSIPRLNQLSTSHTCCAYWARLCLLCTNMSLDDGVF